MRIRRPIWVWAVLAYHLLNLLYVALCYVFLVIPVYPANAVEAYLKQASMSAILFPLGIALFNFSAAVILLMLRRLALRMFAASLGASVLFIGSQIVYHGWAYASPSGGVFRHTASAAVTLVVCLYCWRLYRRGVLS